MTDNPGLFPLHQGKAVLKESEWTLIKIMDYTLILNDYQTLRGNLMKSITLLENRNYPSTDKRFEKLQDTLINHKNQLLILKQYINKADQLLNQLFPEIQINRPKRSLIEGLGNVIKFITGNLDAEDGRRYEKIISKLNQDLDTQKYILSEQAQILNETLSAVHDLSENQKLLNSNLNKILLSNAKLEETITEITTYSIIDQSIQSLQLFINIWIELENALTFAQKQQLHLSLIENDELIQSLNKITESLDQLQIIEHKNLALPYASNYKNLHLYESIITTKIYQKDKIFVFIFEIPLVKPFFEYQLLKLIPFPIYIDNDQFRMIIPSFNTILFHEDFSVPIESNGCQLTSANQYFCSSNNHFSIPNSKLCETQLLSFHDNQTCQPYIFDLATTKIAQVDSNTWLVSSPNRIILDIKCQVSTTKREIKGTVLIHLTSDCSVLINHEDILFNMKSSTTKEIGLSLHSIGKLQVPQTQKINVSKLDLTPINTHKLVKTRLRLTNKQIVTSDNYQVTTKLSLSSLIIVSVFIIVLVCILAYIYLKRNSFKYKLTNLLKTRIEAVPIQKEPDSILLQCQT